MRICTLICIFVEKVSVTNAELPFLKTEKFAIDVSLFFFFHHTFQIFVRSLEENKQLKDLCQLKFPSV